MLTQRLNVYRNHSSLLSPVGIQCRILKLLQSHRGGYKAGHHSDPSVSFVGCGAYSLHWYSKAAAVRIYTQSRMSQGDRDSFVDYSK